MKLNSLVLVFLCLLLSVVAQWADAQQPILQVRAEPWPELTHADGGGYLFEVVSAVYEPLGYNINFQFCPWRRCILEVINGQADIIVSIFANEAGVGDKLLLPKYPINLEKIGAIFKRERYPQWQGQSTMAQQTISQNRGYDLHRELSVPVNVNEVSNPSQSWMMLKANRVDFLLGGLVLLERLISAEGVDRERYRIEELYQRPAYLGYTNSERGRQLLKEFEQRLPALYQSGQIEQLQKQWRYPWPIPLQ